MCERLTCSVWVDSWIHWLTNLCVGGPSLCVSAAGFVVAGWMSAWMFCGVCRCICLCADVWMPDLREVCGVEPPRVLVLDNWVVCKCATCFQIKLMLSDKTT